MYLAKDKGKNNVQFYTSELADMAARQFEVEAALRLALTRGELLLHFQPKIDIASGRMVGAEALVRWAHPTRGLVPPDEFIPLAEERGLIVPIGRWVIQAACRQIRDWRLAGFVAPPVAVNLSARQFASDSLVDDLVDALTLYGVAAVELEVELTESVLMADPERANEVLQQLHAMGVRIAIDDFGTGYSSLSYLKRFPAQTVKIDRSFIRGLPSDDDDTAITQAVIAMAHSLGLGVVAEGVETVEQLGLLRKLGCDQAQGYLLGRPVQASDLAARLSPEPSPATGWRDPAPVRTGPRSLIVERAVARRELVGYVLASGIGDHALRRLQYVDQLTDGARLANGHDHRVGRRPQRTAKGPLDLVALLVGRLFVLWSRGDVEATGHARTLERRIGRLSRWRGSWQPHLCCTPRGHRYRCRCRCRCDVAVVEQGLQNLRRGGRQHLLQVGRAALAVDQHEHHAQSLRQLASRTLDLSLAFVGLLVVHAGTHSRVNTASRLTNAFNRGGDFPGMAQSPSTAAIAAASGSTFFVFKPGHADAPGAHQVHAEFLAQPVHLRGAQAGVAEHAALGEEVAEVAPGPLGLQHARAGCAAWPGCARASRPRRLPRPRAARVRRARG